MNRQEANKRIVEILSWYIDKYPDIRFSQLLYNLKIVEPNTDSYYEESKVTLKRAQKILMLFV